MLRSLRAALALLVVALGLVLVVDSPASAACTCKPQTPARQVERASVVFVGTVDSQRAEGTNHVYTLTATRSYKGTVERSTQVESGGACGLGALRVGRAYVFLAKGEAAPYAADNCGGTALANGDSLRKVERILGEGTAIEPPPPPTATRTKVEDAEPYGFARLAAPGAAAVLLGLLGLFVVRRLARH